MLRQGRVLRVTPRVTGKIRIANRETLRGSRKKPNLCRSATGRRETADVNSHITRRGLEKSRAKRHGRGTVGARHDLCESNTVVLCYSNGKDTI